MSTRTERTIEAAAFGLLLVMVLYLAGSCILDHQLQKDWPVDYAAVSR